MKTLVYCVIPNWNGKDSVGDAIESLQKQSQPCTVVVVENGSTDGSLEYIAQNYPDVVLLEQPKNLGFAEGVNVGIRYAIGEGADYIALFNNDATADKDWLKHLVAALDAKPKAGLATCKFMDITRKHLDSTGDQYTTWGLPYPRGRGEPVSNIYDTQNWVFGGSGGASLYRTTMLQKIGLFDKNFFAYYEDIDISFRAQLAGWKAYYEPRAVAYHQIGATSSKIKGFTTLQTMKNLPMLFWKNVPFSLLYIMWPRFSVAYLSFLVSAIQRGQGGSALKGLLLSWWYGPKKLVERWRIQHHRTVPTSYIRSILTWDLPPNASKLRKLRRRKA